MCLLHTKNSILGEEPTVKHCGGNVLLAVTDSTVKSASSQRVLENIKIVYLKVRAEPFVMIKIRNTLPNSVKNSDFNPSGNQKFKKKTSLQNTYKKLFLLEQ